MKLIRLGLCLLCAAAVIALSCSPGYDDNDYRSTVTLVVENKTAIAIYVKADRVDGGVNTYRTVRLSDSSYEPISDLTFGGGIAFYNLISDNDQPRPGNLIKRINNADSVVTLVEDERDGSGYGSVVYKLVVTNAMLGIDETQDDGTAETGEDTNTSEPEPEDDDETSSAADTGENNEGENE